MRLAPSAVLAQHERRCEQQRQHQHHLSAGATRFFDPFGLSAERNSRVLHPRKETPAETSCPRCLPPAATSATQEELHESCRHQETADATDTVVCHRDVDSARARARRASAGARASPAARRGALVALF